MPVAYLSRAVGFTAVHRYHKPEWSPEQNRKAFGACADEHGHAYRCQVTVKGPITHQHELVMDLSMLDQILAEEVRGRLDGKTIHKDIPEFRIGQALPSTEGLAVYIWQRIGSRLPAGVRLHLVRVEENPDLFAEYFGEA